MTQENVIKYLENLKYPTLCNSIPEEMDSFIRKNFKEGNDNGKL